MKNILITGAGSYIGDSMKEYLETNFKDEYLVSIKDTINWTPQCEDFKGYDVVFNVAGIAHIKENAANKHLYYEINRDLVIKIAEEAKNAGVKQFILLSSMSVYGLTEGYITKNTRANPKNAYGESKLQADEAITSISDDCFKFVCLRPPMVYGKGCKGNYQLLRKIALKSPIFPEYENQRSMVYIGNLCEFIKKCIDYQKSGLFFPHNLEPTVTSEMVKIIAECHGKSIKMTSVFNKGIGMIPGITVRKVFGNLLYEDVDVISKYGLVKSIQLTEA